VRVLEACGSRPAKEFQQPKLNLVFQQRRPDFRSSKTSSLFKSNSIFQPCKGIASGGNAGALGPHFKKGVNQNKLYFIANHRVLNEYLSFEILNLLKINTPKARFVDKSLRLIATKGFHNYIPIKAVRSDSFIDFDPSLIMTHFRARYSINFKKQIIFDKVERKPCRINGNLFGFYIPSILLEDYDRQYAGSNIGFIRVGDRFNTVVLDKDIVSFNGLDFEGLTKSPSNAVDLEFKINHTVDQALFMVNNIEQALASKAEGICDFQRVFMNDRISASNLKGKAYLAYSNFVNSAKTVKAYFNKQYGRNCLNEFKARERIRHRLANLVIDKLGIRVPGMLEIMIEDLRGVYYQALFVNQRTKLISDEDLSNTALLQQIEEDFSNEFLTEEMLVNQAADADVSWKFRKNFM